MLHGFTVDDGANPNSAPTVLNGSLYATTDGNAGEVFKLLPTGGVTKLYSFTGGADGDQPQGGLTVVNGVLYGITQGGGANGTGAVFKIMP